MKLSHFYPVILAGGSGTRFWPWSRERFPKHLLHLIGRETLLQRTVRRASKVGPVDHVRIVTTAVQAEAVRLQLWKWNDELADHVILEPEGRNTAPAVGLAALRLLRRDPAATMLVLPADHVVKGEAQFKRAVALGYRLAQRGLLVTFGVPPTRAEPGYGYIRPNTRCCVGTSGKLSGYTITRFVEKPDHQTVRRYVHSGKYLWNSGMFMWRADVLIEECARHQPRLLKGLQAIDEMIETGQPDTRWAPRYTRLESLSIDYGVMERSTRAAVVPVDFSWSDVGSWGNLDEVIPGTERGNVVRGNVIEVDSQQSVLFGSKRLVGCIGLSEMLVVDTMDATLICPKSRAQDVKALVEIFRKRRIPERLEHATVHRPWGSYTVLEEGNAYKVKRISVLPGQRLSLQMHQRRSEHWVVIAGTARVVRGKKTFRLGLGESTVIPKRTRHRLENPGKIPLEIIEVQRGTYVGEDDIIRYADEYGRKRNPSP